MATDGPGRTNQHQGMNGRVRGRHLPWETNMLTITCSHTGLPYWLNKSWLSRGFSNFRSHLARSPRRFLPVPLGYHRATDGVSSRVNGATGMRAYFTYVYVQRVVVVND